MSAALAKPLDTEPRRRTKRDDSEDTAEEMPRAVLFDQTNVQAVLKVQSCAVRFHIFDRR
jgi:hypothetical protein